ncbi:MAG: hypothetical protein NVS1B14_09770 [Vulcanimicrobiaceae bacterium]
MKQAEIRSGVFKILFNSNILLCERKKERRHMRPLPPPYWFSVKATLSHA